MEKALLVKLNFVVEIVSMCSKEQSSFGMSKCFAF